MEESILIKPQNRKQKHTYVQGYSTSMPKKRRLLSSAWMHLCDVMLYSQEKKMYSMNIDQHGEIILIQN